MVVTALGRGELDIADADALGATIDRLRPRIVMNCAAYTAVDRAESDAEAATAINATAAGHLARACAESGAALVHFSTDYVFDGTSPRAYVETDAVNPISVYGRSKEAGERLIRAALEQHVILRTSWVYGAHGANFVKTMLRLGSERPALRIVGDQRGCPTAAAELARAVRRVAETILDGRAAWGTYHFCGEGATTWYDFATQIFAESALRGGARPALHRIETHEYPTPAQRPRNSVLDCSLFRARFGLSAEPWQRSLAAVLDELYALPRNGARQ
jgi:dTDP-4-dehydrorhamnose reductase